MLSVYEDADYYTHWIDNTHPSATDTSNPTGTPSVPRLTFPTMTGLAAGSVVQVRGGPYTGSTLNINGAGTVSEPIFITGGTAYSGAELRRAIRVNGAASYIIIEGLLFTTVDESVCQLNPTTNVEITKVCVRDCEFIGNGVDTGPGACCSYGTSFATQLSDLVWLRNKIHEFGDWTALTENDKHGYSGGINSTRIWHLDNEVYHCGGDAIQSGHGFSQDTNPTTKLYIGRNHFYECGENGIDIKQVHDLVISENNLHDFPTDIDAGQCMVLHYGPTTGQGCFNAWVLNNRFHDSNLGVTQSANREDAPNFFIGNVFERITGAALSHNLTSGGASRCYHNTIVDCGQGHDFTSDIASLEIAGDIVDQASIHIEVNTTPDTRTAVKVCCYQGGSNVTIMWEGSTYTTVSTWISSTSTGDGSIQSNPLFTNRAANDFSLQVTSPCIGIGEDMSGVNTTFQATFGGSVSILKDRNGTTRPNGVWDIGAYQYATPAPPAASKHHPGNWSPTGAVGAGF